ncbi:MAG: hypothetical protein KatS3mg102_0256 [Planctomycetota bacterium]|nr:MAG: hypothetical protein KatS3mg102_0256 [Planctomycetota bacterium]
MAAEAVTPQAVNFMAKHGRGLICLALAGEICDQLRLPLHGRANTARFGTAFTVSIEARGRDHDRDLGGRPRPTIRVADAPRRAAARIWRGRATSSRCGRATAGVLVRAGQTEGAVDLARLAGSCGRRG